ncbi:hypothetical protein, partial [Pseudoflavonifractor sp. HCP28S3_F10]|uniref:hypothetical protein n=1 Tax=Pseudoflavonifractor sp. HCP28S3_F10 TaxID=3438947 RepID=UPI003F899996
KAPLLSVDLMPARVGLISREGGLLSPCRWTCGYEIYIEYNREHKEFYDDMHARKSEALSFLYIAVGCAVIAAISLYKWLYYGRTTITVTDKRIYGKAAFGKEVDLPLSNIVMLHKRGKKNMIIATSAGKVRFVGVKNRNEIYGAIQTLMAVK